MKPFNLSKQPRDRDVPRTRASGSARSLAGTTGRHTSNRRVDFLLVALGVLILCCFWHHVDALRSAASDQLHQTLSYRPVYNIPLHLASTAPPSASRLRTLASSSHGSGIGRKSLALAATKRKMNPRNPAGIDGIFDNSNLINPFSNVRVAVLGGGAFSLALSKVLSYKNIRVNLLVRNETIAQTINEQRFHPRYLSSSVIPENLWATTNAQAALADVDYIVHAIPMQQSRSFLEQMKGLLPPDVPILSVTKGVEMHTHCLMNEVLYQTLGPERPTAYLSGPSFAQEIMDGKATAVVIASTESSLAAELSEMLSCNVFRCHVSRDVKGVELGGAVKNVIALAAGMCEGLGLGMNAMSSLVTRGCTEMGRVGQLFGADVETFYGLAGVGDTFGTCLGPLSRNRKAGMLLAQGQTLDEVLVSLDGVSEGIYTSLALQQLICTKVKPELVNFKFPIIAGVASIVQGNLTPQQGMTMLMQYPIRDENRGHL